MTRRVPLVVLAWLGGLSLVVLLVRSMGPGSIWATLQRAGSGLGWVLGTGFAGIAASALPWRTLLPPAARPGLGATLASRTAASGLNAVLPLLSLGDVSRLLWLRRADWPYGLAAMAVERLHFALASAAAIAVGALAAATSPRLPARFVPIAVAAALLIAGVSVFGLWLLARRRPISALYRAGLRLRGAVGWLDRGGSGPGEEIRPVELEQALHAILRGSRLRLGLALLQHLLARALFTLEVYAALRALDVRVDLVSTLAIAAVPIALSLAAAIIPSQIGVQEGTQAAVAAALGLGAEIGLSMTLVLRARQVVLLPIAGLCLALRRRSPPPQP